MKTNLSQLLREYRPLIAAGILAGIILLALWAVAGAETLNIGLEISQPMSEQEFYESLEVFSSDCGELICIRL
jgi:hypothetical protein